MAQEDVGKQLAGYQVYDRHYHKVGKVDGIFVDANDQPEYIGVKIDRFGGHSTLVPMDIVRVNDARQLVEVASEKDTISDAPSFGGDAEITAEFEDRVHAHFGITRGAPLTARAGYGAHYGEDPRVDVAYGERTDAPMPGTAMESLTEEDRKEIPTGAREDSSMNTEYGERADDQAFGTPETHEGHGFRGSGEEVDASDAARRKAGELGIDLTQVVGTGSGGRIIITDVTGLAGTGEPADQYPPDHAEPREGDRVYDWDIEAERREASAGGTGYAGEEAGEVGPGMRMGDTETGEFRGHASDNEGVGQRRGSDLEDEDELRVQRSEEELRAGTREREAGSVNVRKRVRTEHERLSVPTRHEEVTVERVPMAGEATEAQIGEDEVTVPVVEDEVVVQKRPVVKEEIRVRKDVVEEQQVVEEDVRKEEVDVEDATRRRGE